MTFGSLMRKVSLSVVCMVGFGLMTGCASDFVRPAPDVLKLGKSKSEDVIKTVSGSPYQQKDVNFNNEKIDLVTYNTIGKMFIWGTVIPHRTLTYTFFNDVLIGEELNSTYEGEITQFDITKVPQIQKGQTKDQVIAIMGNPSGKVLYPLISDKAGTGFVYAYSYSRFAPVVSPSWAYLLIVTFNENNVVTNISYKENGKEQIVQASN